jgi:hypothetical protein
MPLQEPITEDISCRYLTRNFPLPKDKKINCLSFS